MILLLVLWKWVTNFFTVKSCSIITSATHINHLILGYSYTVSSESSCRSVFSRTQTLSLFTHDFHNSVEKSIGRKASFAFQHLWIKIRCYHTDLNNIYYRTVCANDGKHWGWNSDKTALICWYLSFVGWANTDYSFNYASPIMRP